MKFGPRLFRIAGAFAVGLVALAAAGGSASAATCTLSFAPNPGMAGQTLTITATGLGNNLTGTNSVMIGSSAATIGTVSSTQVTVTIPDEPAPTVTSILTLFSNHDYGSTSGGDTVVITGSNFNPTENVTIAGSNNCDGSYSNAFTYNDVTAVDIGGTAAPSVSVLSSSTIEATTPPGLAGVTNVLVITTTENSGGTGSNLWAYVPGGPSVTAVGPQQGLTTVATAVTITGTNFVSGQLAGSSNPATTVTFNCGTTSGATNNGNASVSNTSIVTATAPTCGTAGVVTVTVTTPAGSATGTYQYLSPAQPIVTGVSPATGGIQGQTQVTITGSNFIGATQVMFGNNPVSAFQVNNANSITTATPTASAAGAVNVSVTVPQATPTTGTGTNLFHLCDAGSVHNRNQSQQRHHGRRHHGLHLGPVFHRRDRRADRRHGGEQLHSHQRRPDHRDDGRAFGRYRIGRSGDGGERHREYHRALQLRDARDTDDNGDQSQLRHHCG